MPPKSKPASKGDPGWQSVQIKTAKAWVNSHLAKRQLSVNDLTTDLCDGRLLIELLEILTRHSMDAKWDRNPTGVHQKIQNVGVALKFMQDRLRLQVASVSAEDVVEGNTKMVLALLWAIIRHFQIVRHSPAFRRSSRATLENTVVGDEDAGNGSSGDEQASPSKQGGTMPSGRKGNSPQATPASSGGAVDQSATGATSPSPSPLPSSSPSSPSASSSSSAAGGGKSSAGGARSQTTSSANVAGPPSRRGGVTGSNSSNVGSVGRSAGSVLKKKSIQGAQQQLLDWVRKSVGDKVQVDNLTTSFQDGLAFCALINAYRPDLIDWEHVMQYGDNKADTLQLAFDTAEEELHVPRLFDPEDIADEAPDELSILVYVSSLYQALVLVEQRRSVHFGQQGLPPMMMQSGNASPLATDSPGRDGLALPDSPFQHGLSPLASPKVNNAGPASLDSPTGSEGSVSNRFVATESGGGVGGGGGGAKSVRVTPTGERFLRHFRGERSGQRGGNSAANTPMDVLKRDLGLTAAVDIESVPEAEVNDVEVLLPAAVDVLDELHQRLWCIAADPEHAEEGEIRAAKQQVRRYQTTVNGLMDKLRTVMSFMDDVPSPRGAAAAAVAAAAATAGSAANSPAVPPARKDRQQSSGASDGSVGTGMRYSAVFGARLRGDLTEDDAEELLNIDDWNARPLQLDPDTTDLQPLAMLGPRLRRLSLRGCHLITDLGELADVAPNVSELSLDGCRRLVDLTPLALFELLRELDLSEVPYDPASFDVLGELSHLEVLRTYMNRSSREVRSIGCLEQLTKLREVRLHGMAFPDLQPLVASAATLQVLSLNRCSVHNLAALSQLEELRELELEGVPATDGTPLGALGATLERLNAASTRFNTYGFLSQMSKLRELDLQCSKFDVLQPLAHCGGTLRRLSVRRCEALSIEVDLADRAKLEADRRLKRKDNLKSMRNVFVGAKLTSNANTAGGSEDGGSEESLAEKLAKSNTQSSIHWSVLSGCTELEELDVSDTSFADCALLQPLHKLHMLRISQCAVHNVGVLGLLPNLVYVGAESLRSDGAIPDLLMSTGDSLRFLHIDAKAAKDREVQAAGKNRPRLLMGGRSGGQ